MKKERISILQVLGNGNTFFSKGKKTHVHTPDLSFPERTLYILPCEGSHQGKMKSASSSRMPLLSPGARRKKINEPIYENKSFCIPQVFLFLKEGVRIRGGFKPKKTLQKTLKNTYLHTPGLSLPEKRSVYKGGL